MHHHQLTLILLLGLILIAGLLVLVLLVAVRSESNAPTVGVILAGPGAMFGWGDVTANGEYAETTISRSRVLVYDNLNAQSRPDVTLEDVVAEMTGRGVRFVFLSSPLDGVPSSEQFPDTVFIMNLATRDNVAALLPALSKTAPDIGQIDIASTGQNSAPTTSTSRGPSSTLLLMACGSALLLLVVIFSVRSLNRHSGPQDVPRTMVGRMIETISQIGDKPKKKHGIESSLHRKRLLIQDAARAQMTDFHTLGEPMPMLHKLTTYVQGDRRYDESFSIEIPAGPLPGAQGEFLGECGAGSTVPADQYHTDKAAAVEVWMFDKTDIRTVSAVLVSQHAFDDETFRTHLKTKGELILAEPDAITMLETKTLRLAVRVLSSQYGYDPTLPPTSFFEHLVIELAVWRK